MAPPTYSVGQVLAASDCNNWFTPEAAYKTSALGRSSATLSLDPDLQVTVAASAFYEVRASLIYQGGSSGTGVQWNFTAPAGFGLGYTAAEVSATFGYTWGTTATASTITGGVVYGSALLGTLSTSSGGTFGLQWASNTGGQTLTMGAGSYLIALRVG